MAIIVGDREKVRALAVHITEIIPAETTYFEVLLSLGVVAATVLGRLYAQEGVEALGVVAKEWIGNILRAAMKLGDLEKESFDFEGWAKMGPLEGEA